MAETKPERKPRAKTEKKLCKVTKKASITIQPTPPLVLTYPYQKIEEKPDESKAVGMGQIGEHGFDPHFTYELSCGKSTGYTERCPENCAGCLDVCPITYALYVSDMDKRIRANDAYWVYCEACKAVFPVDEALEAKCTKMSSHTPVPLGTWNKTLELLTLDITEDLKIEGSYGSEDSSERALEYKAV